MTHSKLLRTLLDQQIWCWGCDIVSPQGNLLVRYGLVRTPRPHDVPGASSYEWNRGAVRIDLRGFGVLYCDRCLAGLFLSRHRHEPTLCTPGQVRRPFFVESDLPELTRVTAANFERARSLLSGLIDWIVGYEIWIAETCGAAWREDSIERWGRTKRRFVPADQSTAAWRTIAQALLSADGHIPQNSHTT